MSDNACCFCGDDVGRYGHNPAPVSDTGRCCDVCNQMVVIPARISMMGFRSEDWQEVFGESSFPAGYEGDIADKILTDTYGEWWVWSVMNLWMTQIIGITFMMEPKVCI